MTKLIVCLTLAAFATMTSLQAGEQCATTKAATSTQAKASCTAETKTACSVETKAACSAAKTTVAANSCCSAKKVAKKRLDLKGGALLVQR